MTDETIPPDDPRRELAVADADQKEPHLAIVGDTYTVLLSGKDTAGRFCLIDMHVAPGGGPPPHRHDFEETFIIVEGEIEVTFRGEKRVVRAGETANIPANAPHNFRNRSSQPARLHCICSPPGLDEYFLEVGIPVATRTAPPPALDESAQGELRAKLVALAAKYRIEFV